MGGRSVKKSGIFVEHISEATFACLIAMTQGNFLAFTLSHWSVALQTGVVAGTLASGLLIFRKIQKPWLVSLIVAGITTGVDFLVHGEFADIHAMIEALVTGAMAGALAFAVTHVLHRRRGARAGETPAAPAPSENGRGP